MFPPWRAPMIEHVKQLGVRPLNRAADKSYGSGEFLAWLLARDIQPHARSSIVSTKHGDTLPGTFRYEPRENAYHSPEGKPLHYRGQRRRSHPSVPRSNPGARHHIRAQK